MKALCVPFLGEGIQEILVSGWHLKVGDKVSVGEDVVELAADKAIFNLPSPCAGTLKKILVDQGREAQVGDTLGIIE